MHNNTWNLWFIFHFFSLQKEEFCLQFSYTSQWDHKKYKIHLEHWFFYDNLLRCFILHCISKKIMLTVYTFSKINAQILRDFSSSNVTIEFFTENLCELHLSIVIQFENFNLCYFGETQQETRISMLLVVWIE